MDWFIADFAISGAGGGLRARHAEQPAGRHDSGAADRYAPAYADAVGWSRANSRDKVIPAMPGLVSLDREQAFV
jgi:hypothetical protein